MSIGLVQLVLIALHFLPAIPIIGLIRAKRHRWAWWTGLAVSVAPILAIYGYPLYLSFVFSSIPS